MFSCRKFFYLWNIVSSITSLVPYMTRTHRFTSLILNRTYIISLTDQRIYELRTVILYTWHIKLKVYYTNNVCVCVREREREQHIDEGFSTKVWNLVSSCRYQYLPTIFGTKIGNIKNHICFISIVPMIPVFSWSYKQYQY